MFAIGVRARNVARARELLAAPISREHDIRSDHGDPSEPRLLSHPCPCCGGRLIVIETFERGRAPRGFSANEVWIDTS